MNETTSATDVDLRQPPLHTNPNYAPILDKATLLQEFESDRMRYPVHRHELRERLMHTDTSTWHDSRL